MMIDEPAVVVRLCRDTAFRVSGIHSELVANIVNLVGEKGILPCDPKSLPIRLELLTAPPRHSGLGSGTQIAFSVAATLFKCVGLPVPEAAQMAEIVGRGKRSAIGSHGFYSGGCIADAGVTSETNFSPIQARISFPDEWPIVLIRPVTKGGLFGHLEQSAFDRLAETESQNRDLMKRLCFEGIFQGLTDRNYAQFGHALHEFNRISGEYFAEFQSGIYNNPKCASIVQSVLDFGIQAVGQSSWGPTLFAVAPSVNVADDLLSYLGDSNSIISDDQTVLTIVKANNCGMRISRLQSNLHSSAER